MTHAELQQIAAEANETGDYTAFDAAFLEAIAALADADALWTLVCVDAIGGAAFGEGFFPEPIVAAMVRRALAAGDAEMLGAIARMGSFEPAAILDDQDWKPAMRSALAPMAPTLRDAWPSADARMRVQIAHALVVGEVSEPDDATRLDQVLADTDDAEVRALALAVEARLDTEPASFLRAQLSDESPLVRLMAACATARLGAPLDELAARPLVRALTEPTPLPRWWAFRTWETWEPGAELAKRALHVAKLVDPTEVVAALAARTDGGWRESETLLHLALTDTGAMDELGLVASTLGPAQRQALSAHGAPPLRDIAGALQPFGLMGPDDVEPFLAETGPLWSVREVALPDASRAGWSVARIWKARVWDHVTHDAALQALTQPLEADDLFELTCTESRGILLQRVGHQREAAHRTRDDELVLGSLSALADSGFDLAQAVRARLGRSCINARRPVTFAALTALADPSAELDEPAWEWLAESMRRWHDDPTLGRLVQQAAAPARERLEGLGQSRD